MVGPSEINVGTVVSWRGADYVIERLAALLGTAFSWRLAELAPAAGGPPAWIAVTGPEVWEAAAVYGFNDTSPLPIDADLLKSVRPAEHITINERSFMLQRFNEATAEISRRDRPTTFDRGRLLEYADTNGRRMVIYISDRRQFAFIAEPAVASELQIYGQPAQ